MRVSFNSEQSGRSMVEILGVLAIVGILSVAGISGYSRAMAKYRISKIIDQVTFITSSLRAIYFDQRSFDNLNTTAAINMGAVPQDMVSGPDSLTNAYNGSVTIGSVATSLGNHKGYYISFQGLGRDACAFISTSDWNSSSQGNLLGVEISDTLQTTLPDTSSGTFRTIKDLPITPDDAATECSASSTITWYYF